MSITITQLTTAGDGLPTRDLVNGEIAVARSTQYPGIWLNNTFDIAQPVVVGETFNPSTERVNTLFFKPSEANLYLFLKKNQAIRLNQYIEGITTSAATYLGRWKNGQQGTPINGLTSISYGNPTKESTGVTTSNSVQIFCGAGDTRFSLTSSMGSFVLVGNPDSDYPESWNRAQNPVALGQSTYLSKKSVTVGSGARAEAGRGEGAVTIGNRAGGNSSGFVDATWTTLLGASTGNRITAQLEEATIVSSVNGSLTNKTLLYSAFLLNANNIPTAVTSLTDPFVIGPVDPVSSTMLIGPNLSIAGATDRAGAYSIQLGPSTTTSSNRLWLGSTTKNMLNIDESGFWDNFKGGYKGQAFVSQGASLPPKFIDVANASFRSSDNKNIVVTNGLITRIG